MTPQNVCFQRLKKLYLQPLNIFTSQQNTQKSNANMRGKKSRGFSKTEPLWTSVSK